MNISKDLIMSILEYQLVNVHYECSGTSKMNVHEYSGMETNIYLYDFHVTYILL